MLQGMKGRGMGREGWRGGGEGWGVVRQAGRAEDGQRGMAGRPCCASQLICQEDWQYWW